MLFWRNDNLCEQLALMASSIRKLNQKFPFVSNITTTIVKRENDHHTAFWKMFVK